MLRLAQVTPHAQPNSDEVYYGQIALRFADGHGLTTQHLFTLADPHPLPTAHIWKPPGYPVLLGVWAAAGGRSYVAVRVFSVLAGTVVVALCGLLAARFTNPRAGLAAAAVAAVHPLLIEWSVRVVPDNHLTACLVGALLCATYARGGRGVLWGVLAGVLWGVAQAIKSIAPVFWAPGLLYLLWRQAGTSLRARLVRGVAVFAGLAPLLAALYLYNVRVTGSISGGPQGIVNAAQNWVDNVELYYTLDFAPRAAEIVDSVTPAEWARHWWTNFWEYTRLLPRDPGLLTIVGVVAGIVLLRRQGHAQPWIIVATLLALYGVLAFRRWPQTRYLMPAFVMALTWCGVAIDVGLQRANPSWRARATGGLAGAVAGWLLNNMVLARPLDFLKLVVDVPVPIRALALAAVSMVLWRTRSDHRWRATWGLSAFGLATIVRPATGDPYVFASAMIALLFMIGVALWFVLMGTSALEGLAGRAIPVVVVGVVGFGWGTTTRTAWWHDAHPDAGVAEVVEFLQRDHAGGGPPVVVACTNTHVAHLDVYYVPLPTGGAVEVAEVARRWNADYVVLEEWWLGFGHRDPLREWFTSRPPAWLEVGRVTESTWYDPALRDKRVYGPTRTVVFRVRPARLPPAA